ncbi:hypothetical protein SS50377_26562 [Spironucleus salmonicida]|uniref:Uncharacterized protein n=1 Tax=Spironucleus salmonicida TaxID=348837 RepID=V6LCL3_9EUKA|nr:hypothetical protein SS50377_26562 [Spironucleus salmonicida]|eukprot:EST41416.1 hypothetical protein SS50377_19133 [Spironucleus salmonicida]
MNPSQSLFELETRLADPKIDIVSLNNILSIAKSLPLPDSSQISQRIFQDRLSQVILDCEMQLNTFKVIDQKFNQVSSNNYQSFNETNRIFDETIEMAGNAQSILNHQTAILKNIHLKVLSVAGKLEIGGKTVDQILRIEQLGGFIRAIAVGLIIVIWLCIKILM